MKNPVDILPMVQGKPWGFLIKSSPKFFLGNKIKILFNCFAII